MYCLFFLIHLSSSFAPVSLSPQQADPGVVQVCAVGAVPYGYVIIGKTTTEQCRANAELPERDNTLIIKKPGLREMVCEKSPFPSNYAVVARARLNTCPSNGIETDNNAWIINKMK
jgi:hypothetical protein